MLRGPMITRKNGALLSSGNYSYIIFRTFNAYNSFIIRDLARIANILKPVEAQNRAKGFITASDDAGRIKECIQKVEQALSVYQVCSLTRGGDSLLISGLLVICYQQHQSSHFVSPCKSSATYFTLICCSHMFWIGTQ
jgi:hypothetical protein